MNKIKLKQFFLSLRRRNSGHHRLLPIRQFKIFFNWTPWQIQQPVEHIRWFSTWGQNVGNQHTSQVINLDKTMNDSHLMIVFLSIFQVPRFQMILPNIHCLSKMKFRDVSLYVKIHFTVIFTWLLSFKKLKGRKIILKISPNQSRLPDITQKIRMQLPIT
jgi:hypothetical protein